ncbi:MAG: hypothetical protein SFU53_02750 [Terrimicrobiaceae bacterium]|nr:hypothetical protein [Terrimicrobiaceae bacterium]
MKAVIGSLVAAVGGWAACVLAWGGFGLAVSIADGFSGLGVAAILLGAVALYCGVGVLAAWAAVVVWLYLFLPATSALWRPLVAAITGAITGPAFLLVIVLLIARRIPLDAALLIFVASAAWTGVWVGLIGAWTVRFFRKP